MTRVEPRSQLNKRSPNGTGFWEQQPSAKTFTGPPTSAQLMALRHLEYISEKQEPTVPPTEKPKGFFEVVHRQGKRISYFAVNGLTVFIIGIAIQVMLIDYVGMSHDLSYMIQTALSVQLNFILSRYVTWWDRNTPFLGALARFNLQQFAVTGLGMAVYAGLDRFGMNYITANVAVTAVLTPVSFISSHRWSMADRAQSRAILKTLPWPLFAVLVVQVALALRLIWSNTAFIDEATYLYAGSQELNHWLHGAPVANYQTFLSGAPVTYPPIGAIVSSIGGLTAARLLALAFMLGSTALLYATARELFGAYAGILGAAIFAVIGVTEFLSAFATYDPMALFLLALSTYLAVRKDRRRDSLTSAANKVVIAAAALALANATKYASGLWDPIVLRIRRCCSPVLTGRSWW